MGAGEPVAAGAERAIDEETNAEPAAKLGRQAIASVLPFPLAVATLVLTYWCVDIVAPALPDIQQALTLSGTSAGLVFSLFFTGRLIANLPAAILVDRIGARQTAGIGGALLAAGSLLAAVAQSEALLLPARGIQGAGVALLATAGLLSVLRARPAGGAAMTTFNISVGIGGGIGLWVGGELTSAISWRAVFALSTALSGIIVAGAFLTRASAKAAPSHRDRPSPVIPAPDDATPVRRTALAGALLANLLVYGNYSVFIVLVPLYAAARFDATASQIGLLLLVINMAHLVAAFPAGRTIRRWGARQALVGGFVVTAAGLALSLAAPDVRWLALPMTIYAIGQVAGSSAAGDLLLRLGGQGRRAVGMVRLSSDVGLVAGPAAIGALADAAGVSAPFVALSALTGLVALATWRAPSTFANRRVLTRS